MVQNGSFELQGVKSWEAQSWTIEQNVIVHAAGFNGEYDSLHETFDWFPFNEPVWHFIPFSGGLEYETFEWFYGYIPEFYEGAFNAELHESFTWDPFNDTLTVSTSTVNETFEWFTFDDTFTVDDTAFFDSGSHDVETFENDWS